MYWHQTMHAGAPVGAGAPALGPPLPSGSATWMRSPARAFGGAENMTLEPSGARAESICPGCTPAGTAPTGASCVDSEDCSPGHFCGDPGTGDECIRLCTVSTGGPECGAFEDCNSFSDPAIVGGTEYGFCF